MNKKEKLIAKEMAKIKLKREILEKIDEISKKIDIYNRCMARYFQYNFYYSLKNKEYDLIVDFLHFADIIEIHEKDGRVNEYIIKNLLTNKQLLNLYVFLIKKLEEINEMKNKKRNKKNELK